MKRRDLLARISGLLAAGAVPLSVIASAEPKKDEEPPWMRVWIAQGHFEGGEDGEFREWSRDPGWMSRTTFPSGDIHVRYRCDCEGQRRENTDGIPRGTATIATRIYDAPKGGKLLWQSEIERAWLVCMSDYDPAARVNV